VQSLLMIATTCFKETNKLKIINAKPFNPENEKYIPAIIVATLDSYSFPTHTYLVARG